MSELIVSRTNAKGPVAAVGLFSLPDPERNRLTFGKTFESTVADATNSIETTRLLLRVPELADAEALMEVFWDPEVVAQKQVTLREPPKIGQRFDRADFEPVHGEPVHIYAITRARGL